MEILAENDNTSPIWDQILKTFEYGNEIYSRIDTDECIFSVDEEIVWDVSLYGSSHESNDSPFIGTIKFIGRKKKNVIAAVVQFDQPTGHLPQYIREPPNNRNLVNISELIPLSEWIQNFNYFNNAYLHSLPDSTTEHSSDESTLLSITPALIPSSEGIQDHQVVSSTLSVTPQPPPVVNEEIQAPIIFSHDGKQCIEFTESHFKIGDKVVWLLVHDNYNLNEPFSGCIEFVGRLKESDDDVVYAIVKFDKPTYELPGYLKNPPKNRNIVDINDLLILSQWKAMLQRGILTSLTNTTKSTHSKNQKDKKIKKEPIKKVVKLIGNCLAVEYGIDKTSVKEIVSGDFIILKVKTAEFEKTVLGEVKISCKIKMRDDDDVRDEMFVGVEFQNTLNMCSPTIEIRHKIAKDLECKKCQGGKLVMISINTLKNCNPANNDCTFYIVSHKKT